MRSAPQVEETPPRILIVDDDVILAQVLSRYLRRHGMQTQCVADGNEVVDAVQRQPPDLMLLDVMLPGRGGREAAPGARLGLVSR